MKKIKSILITVLLLTISLGATAQTKSNVLKTNLFSPLLKTYWLSYEHLINESTGVQLGFFYTGVNLGSTNISGFALTPEVRFYLSESAAPKGIYVAPGLRYTNFALTVDDAADKATYSAFGAALIVGAQALLKEKITLEAYVGPSYSFGSFKIDSGSEESFDLGILDGFGVRIGITLGFAF